MRSHHRSPGESPPPAERRRSPIEQGLDKGKGGPTRGAVARSFQLRLLGGEDETDTLACGSLLIRSPPFVRITHHNCDIGECYAASLWTHNCHFEWDCPDRQCL